MNVVFLGYMVPLEKMNEYSGISVAGNKMQYNIINELNKLANVNVYSVSILPYACFPKDAHIWIRAEQYDYNNISCHCVWYLNLPIIKQITQIYSVYKEAKLLLKSLKKTGEKTIVVGFNMFPQIGMPMRKLKKYADTFCVLADLPIDDATERKGLSKYLRTVFEINTRKNISACNNYIILSKYVKQDLLDNKNALIIEGGINEEDVIPSNVEENKNVKTVIVFSGALTEYNGIINLVESMKYLLKEDVELRIYGNGYLKQYILDSQEGDERIKYYGQISNDEMRKVQQEADILINPRQVDNQISRYTFPSKTFEYFLSKTIVVSTLIPSYPDEYLDKIVVAEDSPQGLADAIIKVLRMSCEEKKLIEERAYRFVVEEKKWSSQIEKIYQYIKCIVNEGDTT